MPGAGRAWPDRLGARPGRTRAGTLSVVRPSVRGVKSESEDVMNIDCDSCEVRGLACGDCVVTYLLGSAPDGVAGIEFDQQERAALDVLAASGLVPPLRLVRASGRGTDGSVTQSDQRTTA